MVNVPYHTARMQGKIMRSFYKAMIPQIVKLPISQTQKIPLSVYALSCERDLPEQVLSLRSFIRHAGIPDRFTIVSDGSYTENSCNLLRQIHPCVEILTLEQIKRTDLPQCVYDYADRHSMGRKLLALLSLPVQGTTIYTDSDILFFPGASDLVNVTGSDNISSLYLPDCATKMDDRVIYDELEKLNPVNGGFIIFKEPLDWCIALERLSKITEHNHYFTEQTLVHLTMHYNRAKPLCTKRYVLNVEDQFIYPDNYASPEIALRHYVNDVRHKFWLKAGI
ncbi:MAG: hypothetical protein ACRC62_17795 [Microcoleus sp.]